MMYTVKLQNEFLHGAIWVLGEDDIPTFYKLIDEDEQLQSLNKKVETLYDSYFEFDSHGQSVWFDKEKEQANKTEMLLLLEMIKSRLGQINDGSFCVVDIESKKLSEI